MHDLAELPLVSSGKKPAAGVVVVEQDGRVWVVHPSNGFAGYRATFPKGHADEGLSLQATAIREAFEESGLKVQITGFIGDVERTQTMTRYYSARRVGGLSAAMGWETQAVALVPLAQLHTYVNRDVDQTVVARAAFALGSDTTSKPAFSGWQIALGRASGPRPYLGDLQAVGALVRDFIAGIADRYVAVCQGQSTPWEASAADGAECGRMGRIFAGHDPAYESMGEWNEGGGLGRFLAGQLEGMVAEDQLRDPVLAAAQAFAILAHKVYAVLQAVPGDGDGADAQAKLSDIADLMARALLGFENDVFMQE
ncbi:NUDIX hydrolase [Cupriavidus basilensis]